LVEENSRNDKAIESSFLHSLVKGCKSVFLLWLLSKENLHGYAIMSKINEINENSNINSVHSSTVYPILHSLEKDGLIISSEGYNGNHKVKIYQITDKGILQLNSIKLFIKESDNKTFRTYLDEMIFDDNLFVKGGG
jgi:DNA-binding PadR family transcriptional regulator